MIRLRADVAFHGSNFCGWQEQPVDRTVQRVVRDALVDIAEPNARVYGAGRTDAGVHAAGLTAHFDVEREWEPEVFCRALNSRLPLDVRVTRCQIAQPEFHARYSATGRCYVYRCSRRLEPLRSATELHFSDQLQFNSMDIATQSLLGKHDFSSFILAGQDNSPECEIYSAFWTVDEPRFRFHIYGNRFGWRMVRRIVATLLQVGMGKLPVHAVADALIHPSIEGARPVVPAHGLILAGVTYPASLGGPETPQPEWFQATDW